MLAECLAHIPFTAGGIYLDCTFGAGGHSRGILESMDDSSRLYALDADDEAIARAKGLAASDERLHIERANFAQLPQLCQRWRLSGRINAGLADLGVSSPQLDSADRGFSYRLDAPLDMRMDRRTQPDAREWIKHCDAQELRRVLGELGQLRRPGRLANAIVRYRQKREITHTGQLADLVAAVEPAPRSGQHPANNAFRAIRMHINREIESLRRLIEEMASALVQGGRFLLICFHSLEVRLVRAALASPAPRKLPITASPAGRWRLHSRHRPSAEETTANPRARSASLYVLERL